MNGIRHKIPFYKAPKQNLRTHIFFPNLIREWLTTKKVVISGDTTTFVENHKLLQTDRLLRLRNFRLPSDATEGFISGKIQVFPDCFGKDLRSKKTQIGVIHKLIYNQIKNLFIIAGECFRSFQIITSFWSIGYRNYNTTFYTLKNKMQRNLYRYKHRVKMCNGCLFFYAAFNIPDSFPVFNIV